jgi:hypothetical protein
MKAKIMGGMASVFAVNRYLSLHIASSNLSRTIHLESCFLHLSSRQVVTETIFMRKPNPQRLLVCIYPNCLGNPTESTNLNELRDVSALRLPRKKMLISWLLCQEAGYLQERQQKAKSSTTL